MKRYLYCLLFALLPFGLSAQAVSEVCVTSDTLQVYFQQGDSLLDAQFRDNGVMIKEFSNRFQSIKSCPNSNVRSALIVSGASPEGRGALNQKLSDARAKAIHDYLLNNHLLMEENIEVESRGVDWKGLQNALEKSDKPYKNKILNILNSEGFISKKSDAKCSTLMKLENGKIWNDLYKTFFPDLRSSMVMISWQIKKQAEKIDTVEQSTPVITSPAVEEKSLDDVIKIEEQEWKPKLALKTNLLYDAMLIPNIGIEWGIWKGLALNFEYMHNIWLRNNKKHWYKYHAAELGVKYYMNKESKPFEGHHVGLSAQMLTFDVTGILAEPWAIAGIASYGYALPITSSLNIDFEIGLGIMRGDIHKYNVDEGCRVWEKTNKFGFLPKAGITLQWLIGKKK